MFKRITTLLICFLLIASPATSCFVYAADGTPEFFPYQDEMQDSTAAIAVYMKKYGFTMGNVIGSAAENYSAAITSAFGNYCKAVSKPLAAQYALLKAGTGLVSDQLGQYYYSTDAQDLLNDFIDWFAGNNDITDETPKSGVSLGKFGQCDGNLVFVKTSNTNNTTFEWGSCAPLGSLAPKNAEHGYTSTIAAPWGTASIRVSDNASGYTNYLVTITDSGFSSNSGYLYTNYSANNGKEIRKLYGSPCLALKQVGGRTVYNAVVQYYYSTNYGGTAVTHDEYRLFLGSVYKTYDDDIPTLDFTADYDGTKLPDSETPASEPQTITIDTTNYNNYNSNTYTEIINNPSTITIIENDPEDEPYDPYPPTPDNPGGNSPGWDITGGQGNYDPDTHNITFPDFNLPDLNINWSIDGLGNKFPFSIPFDIAALVSVLDAPPEAPRFQGTVNFGFTTWDYDINLEQFDTVAQVCRIAELLLLVFGLILITRTIIKG